MKEESNMSYAERRLRSHHSNLADAVASAQHDRLFCRVKLAKMKKRKLELKDDIADFERTVANGN